MVQINTIEKSDILSRDEYKSKRKRLREEMHEIQEVLGRIHEQKNFYAKFKDGQPYVSG